MPPLVFYCLLVLVWKISIVLYSFVFSGIKLLGEKIGFVGSDIRVCHIHHNESGASGIGERD